MFVIFVPEHILCGYSLELPHRCNIMCTNKKFDIKNLRQKQQNISRLSPYLEPYIVYNDLNKTSIYCIYRKYLDFYMS